VADLHAGIEALLDEIGQYADDSDDAHYGTLATYLVRAYVLKIRALLAAHSVQESATVAAVNDLLGVNLWDVRSFRADVRIDFHEDGSIIGASVITVPLSPAGAVAARIGSHGPCGRRDRHDPHIETSGIVDNGGNIVLDECPGQSADCPNCDDRKCMACVNREIHDVCRNDCPDCCCPDCGVCNPSWRCPVCGSAYCPRTYCALSDTASSAEIKAERVDAILSAVFDPTIQADAP